MGIETVADVASVLAMAFFLALVVERIIQFVIRPLVENAVKAAGREPEKVGLILPYISAVMGGLLSYGFGLDLFAAMAEAAGLEPAAWLTQLLTALVVAGGSNLLHDLWPQGQLEGEDEDVLIDLMLQRAPLSVESIRLKVEFVEPRFQWSNEVEIDPFDELD